MSASDPGPPTSPTIDLLRRAGAGDGEAASELSSHLYRELRGAAERHLRGERPHHSLQATALVHEAYVRLMESEQLRAKDRSHFLALAARVMRHVLVDHARRRGAQRRGGDRLRVTLDELLDQEVDRGLDVLALHEALEQLAELDERKARVVELRFFSGLTAAETAEVLEVSRKTVEADWYMARAWLRTELR